MATDVLLYRPQQTGPGAANTAVQLTVEGRPGKRTLLGLLNSSYSAAAAGSLSISASGRKVYDVDIAAAGVTSHVQAAAPIDCGMGTDVTVTLAAGGAAVVGKLNAAIAYVD